MLFEGVCVHTTVIFALHARENGPLTNRNESAVPGIQIQSARRFSGFYAAPPFPLGFGAFFRQKDAPVREIRYPFQFFEPLSSESAKNDDIGHQERKVLSFAVFF